MEFLMDKFTGWKAFLLTEIKGQRLSTIKNMPGPGIHIFCPALIENIREVPQIANLQLQSLFIAPSLQTV